MWNGPRLRCSCGPHRRRSSTPIRDRHGDAPTPKLPVARRQVCPSFSRSQRSFLRYLASLGFQETPRGLEPAAVSEPRPDRILVAVATAISRTRTTERSRSRGSLALLADAPQRAAGLRAPDRDRAVRSLQVTRHAESAIAYVDAKAPSRGRGNTAERERDPHVGLDKRADTQADHRSSDSATDSGPPTPPTAAYCPSAATLFICQTGRSTDGRANQETPQDVPPAACPQFQPLNGLDRNLEETGFLGSQSQGIRIQGDHHALDLARKG